MKLLIASDIHGAAGYCRDLLAAWDREGADRLLLLGDLLYHGPRNDLPPDYAPKEVIALLNARKNQIFCVRGNCDTEVDQMVLEFPVLADYAVLTAGTPPRPPAHRPYRGPHGGQPPALRDPRPCVQHGPPAAAAARGHPAARPHAHPRLGGVRDG